MAAATSQVEMKESGASCADRQGPSKVLRGAAWKRGWIMCGHDDRLMPYPTNGFNNANTATAGGPLQVPGADGNGGLRLIAKEPGVRYVQLGSGAGSAVASITVTDTGTTRQIYVSMNLSATAATVARALLAHAEASKLVDVGFTGTGGGIVADIGTGTPESVPFVRLLGKAVAEADFSDKVADVDIEVLADAPYTQRFGVLGLQMAAAFSVPGRKYVLDNQTATENYAALLLPIHCVEVDDDLAFCRFE